MNGAVIDAATAVVGTAGFAGLFLPNIEKAWNVSPADKSARMQYREGTRIYLGAIVAVGLMQSVKVKSAFPLVIGLVMAGAILYTYEKALRSDTTKGE